MRFRHYKDRLSQDTIIRVDLHNPYKPGTLTAHTYLTADDTRAYALRAYRMLRAELHRALKVWADWKETELMVGYDLPPPN